MGGVVGGSPGFWGGSLASNGVESIHQRYGLENLHRIHIETVKVSKDSCSLQSSIDTIFFHVIMLCRELLFPVPNRNNPHLIIIFLIFHIILRRALYEYSFLNLVTFLEKLKSPPRLKSAVSAQSLTG